MFFLGYIFVFEVSMYILLYLILEDVLICKVIELCIIN